MFHIKYLVNIISQAKTKNTNTMIKIPQATSLESPLINYSSALSLLKTLRTPKSANPPAKTSSVMEIFSTNTKSIASMTY